jgi:hypothetical protein
VNQIEQDNLMLDEWFEKTASAPAILSLTPSMSTAATTCRT